jgi:hypothetical protein
MIDPSPRLGYFGQVMVLDRCRASPTAESEPAAQDDAVQIHDHVNILERLPPGNAPHRSENMKDL